MLSSTMRRRTLSRPLRRADGVTVGRCFTGDCGSATRSAACAEIDAARLPPEIGQRRRAHALQIATERREASDRARGSRPWNSAPRAARAHHLEQLGDDTARARLQQARDLHRQGRTAGHDMARRHELHRRAHHRRWIDAPMIVEAAIFIRLEQREVARADIANRPCGCASTRPSSDTAAADARCGPRPPATASSPASYPADWRRRLPQAHRRRRRA